MLLGNEGGAKLNEVRIEEGREAISDWDLKYKEP